jgi:hypothetical protein
MIRGKTNLRQGRWQFFASALSALLIGLAACSDSTEVVIPPPPATPINVSVTPGDLEMSVGQTATFVAQVTGGAEGTARTVNWTSSNPGVASVNGSGVVTAEAPGIATILATSTADASAAAAASVRVREDPSNAPISISVKSITTGATTVPVNTQNVFGQIDVTMNVDAPVGANFTIETMIDGTVVCSQSVAAGAADVAASGDETQAQQEIVCSIPTHAFDAETGETTWKNGPRALTARVIRANGNVVATPSTQLLFNNTSFINVGWESSKAPATSAPSPRSLAPAGSLWHSGDITLNLLPVNYGAASDDVASATVSLISSGTGVTGVAGCTVTNDATTDPTVAAVDAGLGVATVPGCPVATASRTGTPGSAISITFPATAAMSAASPGLSNVEDIFTVAVAAVTAGGQAGPTCINPDPNFNPQGPFCGVFYANALRVDNLAPRLVEFDHFRSANNYFGPNSYLISHVAGAAACPAAPATTPWFGLLRPCVRSADYGVGGQTAAGNSLFSAVLAADNATALSANTASELGGNETGTSNDWRLRLAIEDGLGNGRTVFATTTTTAFSATAAGGTRLWGWDETPPTATQTNGPLHMAVNPDETDGALNPFTISFLDSATPPAGPSGFATDPLTVRVERILPNGTTCHQPDTYAPVDCTVLEGQVSEDGVWPTPGAVPIDGYFRYNWFATDAAGNTSATGTSWILEDVTAPGFTGGIVVPAILQGGQPATFSTSLTDNVELGSITPYIGFDVTHMGYPMQMLGEFGPESLTSASAGQVTIPAFMRSINFNDGLGLPSPTIIMANRLSYDVRDMAGHRLRFDEAPWAAPPDQGLCPAGGNTSTQNCSNREALIAVNVLAGTGGVPLGPQFGDLNTMNGLNPLHGRFLLGAPSNLVLCNNAARTDCPAVDTPLTTVLTATATGPAGTFLSPFSEVRFYHQDSAGRWQYIGSGTVTVTDDTVLDTRTYTYTLTWNVSVPRVRPAGGGGTVVTLVALGVNATGDALGSTLRILTVHGN